MLVVKNEDVLRLHGLGHAYDDEVHAVTHIVGADDAWPMVELGPSQYGLSQLRAAPRGSRVTCVACAQWPETLRKLQAPTVHA
jgi:hypothetical protein